MVGGGLHAIYLEQRSTLLRLLAVRLDSRADAEDAVQDMWLRLDRIAGQPVAQPGAYLRQIASNMATDRRIAGARRAARDAAWLDAQPVADDLPDAERMLVARGDLHAIHRTIDAMPERVSIALRLYRLEHRSQRAIAEHLGISVSGVEKLLQRAYRILDAQAALIAGDACGDRP